MGPIWSPFTRSTMGVKEEEGCHTDMHKLEGRGIWKVLLRKPWWHNAGEKKGKEAGLSLGFRWLFEKKKSEKGFQETAGTYVVCVAVDPERCSVGTGR